MLPAPSDVKARRDPWTRSQERPPLIAPAQPLRVPAHLLNVTDGVTCWRTVMAIAAFVMLSSIVLYLLQQFDPSV